MHHRRRRLGDLLRAELAELVLRELNDPRVGFTTITEVRLSADLRHARVYVSVYGSEAEERETIEALTGAEGFLKRHLGQRLQLRYVPSLTFLIDDTLKRSARIEALLSHLHRDDDG